MHRTGFGIVAALGKNGANHQKCKIMSAANTPVLNLVAAIALVGEPSKAGVPIECQKEISGRISICGENQCCQLQVNSRYCVRPPVPVRHPSGSS